MELPGRRDFFKDDFGVTWNRSGPDKDIGVVDTPIFDVPDSVLRRQQLNPETGQNRNVFLVC